MNRRFKIIVFLLPLHFFFRISLTAFECTHEVKCRLSFKYRFRINAAAAAGNESRIDSAPVANVDIAFELMAVKKGTKANLPVLCSIANHLDAVLSLACRKGEREERWLVNTQAIHITYPVAISIVSYEIWSFIFY